MKPTERFSDRVSNYLAYRPSYPAELISTLTSECTLTGESVIADIGSGTGKLTELLLRKNYSVFGIEPNREMRAAAEDLFLNYPKFNSVQGESVKTTLRDNSIDLITAAQAFHWFEPNETKQEFHRILKAGGHIALIWNKRNTDRDFQKDYEKMLTQYCPEYLKVNHHNILDQDINDFNHPSSVQTFSFPYSQAFNLPEFIGRMCSSSYTPSTGTTEYHSLINAAEQLFKDYEDNGNVKFEYETKLYLASVN